ncbi:DUF3592 domain-containing protein [Streptomyces sp. NPDC002742]|uniref:DUF3592 domain-containing protein n=1 Tax=Streptomyces sp. NPDC002742 TaxID=3364663 RepID=UPI00368AE492
MCWAMVTACCERARHETLLAAALTAPGRVVAVREHTLTDDDGTTSTAHIPVVVFTTHDDRTATGRCRTDSRDSRHSLGVTCLIHYAPADPAVFTANPVTDQRAHGCDLFVTGPMVLAGLAVTLVGVINLPYWAAARQERTAHVPRSAASVHQVQRKRLELGYLLRDLELLHLR